MVPSPYNKFGHWSTSESDYPSHSHHHHQLRHASSTCSIISSTGSSTEPEKRTRNCCLISVLLAFVIGMSLGVVLPLLYLQHHRTIGSSSSTATTISPSSSTARSSANHHQHHASRQRTANYSTVTFIDRSSQPQLPARVGTGITPGGSVSSQSSVIIRGGIYWGEAVEQALPGGYGTRHSDGWSEYVARQAAAVQLSPGCGRMQNRMVTFHDGVKACVRYRQNTDQIQGELFSFYLAQILRLPNLAPSTVSVVDAHSKVWRQLGDAVAAAQWYPNRPVVVTRFLANLDAAPIPSVFRPLDRHLNRDDVLRNITRHVVDHRAIDADTMRALVELAQWSDLIIFDYLTANLDRVVNNLYNYQWNANIMEAPAHNLARNADSGLLVFLDNESGLLHGYRLLKKYEAYHALLLDNLCVFRAGTVAVLKRLRRDGNVGFLLREMFDKYTDGHVKDVLPTIPDNSIKILNERIEKVYAQVARCEDRYGPPSAASNNHH